MESTIMGLSSGLAQWSPALGFRARVFEVFLRFSVFSGFGAFRIFRV